MNETSTARAPATDPRMGLWKRRLSKLKGDWDRFIRELAGEGVRLTDGAKKALRGRARHGTSVRRPVTTAAQRSADDERIRKEARRQRRLAMTAADILKTSDGSDTRGFRTRLAKKGRPGELGYLLLAAYKASSRAKAYRGGIKRGRERVSFRELSYDRKDEQLAELAKFLSKNPGQVLTWGWGRDSAAVAPHVLYVDLPEGQVSFHCQRRHHGPMYPGTWDGLRDSEARIVRYCDRILAETPGDSP